MKYLSSKTVTQILGVTAQTLRNWDREGKLKPAYVKSNGYRYYSEEQILAYTQERKTKKVLNVIGYIRANDENDPSLALQKDKLNEYLANKYDSYSFIFDYSNALDMQRPGLMRLIEMINRKEVDVIALLNKGILLQFGFELVEKFASLNNVKIEILEKPNKDIRDKELISAYVNEGQVLLEKLNGKHKQILKTNIVKYSAKLTTLVNKD